MEDEADAVEQQLRRQDRGHAGGVIGRRHLDQVHADDVAAAAHRQRLDDLQHLVIQKTAMAGRAGARCDRRVKAVDVDRQVVIEPGRDPRQHAGRAQAAHVAHRQDLRARSTGGSVVVTVGRGHIANADLRHADHVVHLGGAAQRVAVAVAHAVALVNKIQVGIDMQDVDRAPAFKRLHHRRMDRVVAAQHHRHGALLEHLAHRQLDVGVAADHVGVDDVGVAGIDDAHLLARQVHHIVFKVVGAGVAK